MSSSVSRRHTLVAFVAVLLSSCSGRLSGGGGGSGNAAGTPASLPPLVNQSVEATGLLSAVAGPGLVQLEWSSPAGTSFAIHQSDSEATLYDGVPLSVSPPGSRLVVDGLVNGTTQYFGLALLADGNGAPSTPVGAVLHARPGPVIHVDVAGPGGSGATPEEPMSSLFLALLLAGQAGGGNVWVAGGDYGLSALPVFSGTALYGGFSPGFVVDERDPDLHPTRLLGATGQPVLSAQVGSGVVLDGLTLQGGGIGLDAGDVPVLASRLVISGCSGPGVRLTAPEAGDPRRVTLVSCTSTGNGAEGLSGRGGLDVSLIDCSFTSNLQEGVDLDDLVAPDGRTARLIVRGGLFAGNGTEGLDADCAPPLAGGTVGGQFEITVSNAVLERNGASGLLIDIDHEQDPAWNTQITLRGLVARANRGPGVHLDLDAASSTLIHRLRSSSNGAEGLLVSSESHPVIATLTASALDGNLGAAMRVLDGQAAVLVSHSVSAGNEEGLRQGVVPSSALSCLGWRQPDAFGTVTAQACASIDKPSAAPLARVPDGWWRVENITGGQLSILGSDVPTFGQSVELADDGIHRIVASFDGGTLDLEPPPAAPPALPSVVAHFSGTGDVDEDWRALPGSPADETGQAPPGAAPPDLGPFGLIWGGTPGFEEAGAPDRHPLISSMPSVGTPLARNGSLHLRFRGGGPQPASVGPATVVVLDAAGTSLAVTTFALDDALVIAPPSGGWPIESLRVLLHEGLLSADGTALAVPLLLPLEVTP